LPLDKASVLREDHSALRNSLLASLLDIRRYNQDHRTGEARLFELGKVFLPSTTNLGRPEERAVLALVDDRGFQALTDTLARVGEALHLEASHLKIAAPLGPPPNFLNAEHACHIQRVREMVGNERAEDSIGWLGVISAELQKAFDLRKPAAVCELDLMKLATLPHAPSRYVEPAAYPEVIRDIALVIDETITWSDVDSFSRQWAEPLRDKAEAPGFMSVFRGKQVGAGKKSLAFSLTYRAPNRTLTDDEVNAAHKKFQDALLAKFDATLRV